MLSAFSARQAFGLLYPGAVGETKETIAEVIGFDDDVDSALETLTPSTTHWQAGLPLTMKGTSKV